MQTLIAFIVSFVGYIVLDLLWLGIIAKPIVTKFLSPWMTDGFKIAPAIAVYVLLALGLTFFVIPKSDSWYMALLFGAVMGLVVYGVYDLTNLSTIANWPWKFVLVDIGWGIVSGGIVGMITYFVTQALR